MDISKRIIDNEVAFFVVLASNDLWKELKKHMFPGRKVANFYGYRDGDTAAYYGYLGLIQESKQLTFTVNALDDAAGNGHYDIVQFLHYNRFEGCTRDAMDWAAGSGYLKIVEFLHHNRKEGCTTDAIDNAASNGHIEVVKFLHYNREEGCTTDAMDFAMVNGFLEVVKFLHKNREDRRIGCTENGVFGTTINGHVQIIKFLYYNTKIFQKGSMIENTIKHALQYEKSEIAKFLQEVSREH